MEMIYIIVDDIICIMSIVQVLYQFCHRGPSVRGDNLDRSRLIYHREPTVCGGKIVHSSARLFGRRREERVPMTEHLASSRTNFATANLRFAVAI